MIQFHIHKNIIQSKINKSIKKKKSKSLRSYFNFLHGLNVVNVLVGKLVCSSDELLFDRISNVVFTSSDAIGVNSSAIKVVGFSVTVCVPTFKLVSCSVVSVNIIVISETFCCSICLAAPKWNKKWDIVFNLYIKIPALPHNPVTKKTRKKC